MSARVLPNKKPWARMREKLAYPMYVIPVQTFLTLDGWVPHQDALESGLLREYDDDAMAGKVVFISHQWSGWMHPDPKLEQMNALKGALRRFGRVELGTRPGAHPCAASAGVHAALSNGGGRNKLLSSLEI